MNEEETKEKLINTLSAESEFTIKAIAKKTGISTATASKYLNILKAEKKVKSRRQPPYSFWSLREKVEKN